MRGKAKLFCRFADGSRQSVVLPFAWVPAQAREIQAAVETVAGQVAAGASLAEAAAPFTGKTAPLPAPQALPEGPDLLRLWRRFGEEKMRSGRIKPTTWEKDYGQTGRVLPQVVGQAGNAKELLTWLGGEVACRIPPPPDCSAARCRNAALGLRRGTSASGPVVASKQPAQVRW